MVPDAIATLLILISGAAGLVFAYLYARQTAKIEVDPAKRAAQSRHADSQHDELLHAGRHGGGAEHLSDYQARQIHTISEAISVGANAFLKAEYTYMGVFVIAFGLVLFILLGAIHDWTSAAFTMFSFVLGSLTSVVSGWVGMRIAVFANARTTLQALRGYGPAFLTAFKAGAVMGFALVSLGLLVLYLLVLLVGGYYSDADRDQKHSILMYEAIAGYGLGGSSIALFGRVGGGIYTKAADVGADQAKIDQNLNEDSPQNPAVIADNVGDNVGDVAGMGADLFGSFAEASCAAMVVASQSPDLFREWPAMMFPLAIIATGILVCILTSFAATHLWPVRGEADVEPALKRQLLISTALMTPVAFMVCMGFLPSKFDVVNQTGVKNWHIFICVAVGLWAGLAIGLVTEYYTSHSYKPVRKIADVSNKAATNIIYGLALGYKSTIVPVMCLSLTIYISYALGAMFGIAAAALGILSTMATGLTIDAYGPICDNAGGIAEMSGLPARIRDCTDALDAAGNTTAAIGKGFAIGSAALVSLALFGAFVTTVGLDVVNILRPFQFAGLLFGSMLPYWFTAMTLRSVGEAANAMSEEVSRQFAANDQLRAAAESFDQIEEGPEYEQQMADWIREYGDVVPDYARCIAISTQASLHEMLAPGALVMLTPLIVGFFFGVEALAGVLAGILVSGVQMAISASNTGGAWDNAKKYIEANGLGEGRGKRSEWHKNAVIGDTVGDPLKDTSGPSLNILIKLSAILSLVFAPAFPSVSTGGLLVQLFRKFG